MIKLENNRRFLYQWSLNKRVIVDGFLSGTRVEFSRRFDCKESALPVVAYEDGGHIYADIPNILLQSPGYIRAQVCPSVADTGHMPEQTDIKIVRRKKPDDYTYTETPTLSLENKLDKYWGEENKGKTLVIGDDGYVKPGAVSSGGSGGGAVDEETIARLVEEYLEANPPVVTETDPTVPDWAKQPEKPKYTADEVGALSQGELQAGINLALEQAKNSGVFDGAPGKSAYQYAQDGGYTGTEEEFAEKLAKDVYSKAEMDAALASYITDVDALIGGEG